MKASREEEITPLDERTTASGIPVPAVGRDHPGQGGRCYNRRVNPHSLSAPRSPVARVLLTKIGLDGHDRGLRIVATGLRDASMEVIFLGPWAALDEVVSAAVQEDVDVVGVSSLAYDHVLVPELIQKLRAAGWDGPVLLGGIVQDVDVPALLAAGVAGIFHPGARVAEIADFIRSAIRTKEAAV